MSRRALAFLTVALLGCGAGAPAATAPPGKGLHELPDTELNALRGRYTIDPHTVAWFGVSMISTWQTADGRLLQGSLTLGMDFSHGQVQPVLSFTPSVTITRADAPVPMPATGTRTVDGSGLANVGGLLQSVQVAGDDNVASNVAQLTIREGAAPTAGTGAGGMGSASTSDDGATATAGFDGNAADVSLTVAGQGAVQQWIREGSLGQSVQLAADGQAASNRLEIVLVRDSISVNAPLAQNVAQAIDLTRGMATH